jgi:hypothetical protein
MEPGPRPEFTGLSCLLQGVARELATIFANSLKANTFRRLRNYFRGTDWCPSSPAGSLVSDYHSQIE